MGSYITTEQADGSLIIRLINGVTNLLTTDVLREISAVVDDANAAGQGVLLCGGDKFFSNGVNIGWGLGQSTETMRTMFLELGHLVLRLLESPSPGRETGRDLEQRRRANPPARSGRPPRREVSHLGRASDGGALGLRVAARRSPAGGVVT